MVKCLECDSDLDFSKATHVAIGYFGSATAFPCRICGRLHLRGGQAVNRRKKRAFLVEEGIIFKDANDNISLIF